MKKILLLAVLFIFTALGLHFYSSPAIAANGQTSNDDQEFATVDTAPGADGYGTNAINVRRERVNSKWKQVWFSIAGSGVMTVTLQFKKD